MSLSVIFERFVMRLCWCKAKWFLSPSRQHSQDFLSIRNTSMQWMVPFRRYHNTRLTFVLRT